MNTQDIAEQHISAFADGEMADGHLELALASLCSADGREAWDVYHQIGDVLRSDEMAIALSPDFAARMSARLEAEPTVVAPGIARRPQVADRSANIAATGISSRLKRFAMPYLGVAAVAAAIVFVGAPQQLMVASKGSDGSRLAMSNGQAVANMKTVSVSSSDDVKLAAAGNGQEGVVLRDPRIDEYLLAHQRFSPSLFGTAQYARSAAFATESNK